MEQIRLRDARDEQRATAPMKPASDAVIVDTSSMEVDEVVQLLFQRIVAGTTAGNGNF